MQNLEEVRVSRTYISNEMNSEKTSATIETCAVCGCISVYRYPEIREENVEASLAFPRFPRKSVQRAEPGQPRAFHSIFITAYAPSNRELGGHPVSQRSRGMQIRARSQRAPPPVALGGFKRSGRKTDADRRTLCRFTATLIE